VVIWVEPVITPSNLVRRLDVIRGRLVDPAPFMSIPHISRWPDLGPFWTVPNVLSLARLVLVLPISVLLWVDGSLSWLFGLVLVAILTDWFDGRLARWSDTESEWGKVLDPIADKVGAVATIFALTFRSPEPHLPLWFFSALISRDALILAGSMLIVRRSGKVASSVWAGKAATFWLAVTVLAAVLKADPPVLAFCVWMTTALLGISFVVYVIRYLNAARRTPPTPPRTPFTPEPEPDFATNPDTTSGDGEPAPPLSSDAPSDAPSDVSVRHDDPHARGDGQHSRSVSPTDSVSPTGTGDGKSPSSEPTDSPQR